ncbi:MAG: hypothetical protein AAB225_15385 [Acidobacteriota bacterium]
MFDKGNNSEAAFDTLAATPFHFVGSAQHLKPILKTAVEINRLLEELGRIRETLVIYPRRPPLNRGHSRAPSCR